MGDRVWVFDANVRHYTREGAAIWRKSWVEKKVIFENSKSFFVAHSFHTGKLTPQFLRAVATRIPKSGTRSAFVVLSEEELDERVWLYANGYEIRSRISHTDKLTKAQHLILAEMVGFKDFK